MTDGADGQKGDEAGEDLLHFLLQSPRQVNDDVVSKEKPSGFPEGHAAGWTGLEPAPSGVTATLMVVGRRNRIASNEDNQVLNKTTKDTPRRLASKFVPNMFPFWQSVLSTRTMLMSPTIIL